MNKKSQAKIAAALRESLRKLLPGFEWTVHNGGTNEFMEATGIQSSGFNRLATIGITKKGDWYEAKIAGNGTRALWSKVGAGRTLHNAVGSLQNGLELERAHYAGLLLKLKNARLSKSEGKETK